MLHIERVHRAQADQARGVVIVIDVIRAFSVASYAFANGARGIWLVRTAEDALVLRVREPTALLAGEVGGRLISGFDYNNSPARMAAADLHGKLLIQTTGAGTRGAVGAVNARRLLVSALVNARATAAHARALALAADGHVDGGLVTLMPTESSAGRDDTAMEDDICADYLEALLLDHPDAPAVLADCLERIRASGRLAIFAQDDPDFPPEDVPAFMDANRFDFAIAGTREQWHDITYIATHRVDVPIPARSV
jgi:2-phosphosulfolactate phosphatase